MPDSMITQCPKCSTAFRVSDDVLNMAKGKVRCGQCFHIFEAKSHASQTPNQTIKATPTSSKPRSPAFEQEPKSDEKVKQHSPNLFTSADDDDDLINPDWLNTLISDDDLEPIDKTNQAANLNPNARQAIAAEKEKQSSMSANPIKVEKEPAPWEVELAELEASQKKAPKSAPNKKAKSDPFINLNEDASFLDSQTLAQPQNTRQAAPQTASKANASDTQAATEAASQPQAEPEYMQALQELAQSVSQTKSNNRLNRGVSHNLGELMDDPNELAQEKPKHTWRWALACFVFILISAVQVLVINYETGSRSASFRPIYNIVCSYYGCELPVFEDVNTIDIQHVRVQSHATKENALVVNAIMTNHSNFSQPMPKIAMEFYDLNGNPVAARLFSQQDFLDKDFLDITYMPPKTPIHLVIEIADPGASAVTHKLKVYRAQTRSY